ncbi:MAG: BMC domain-containing protein [Clostridia bacterium]|nr:BMC domain-containing protein [Clostridia bacterium]
MASGALGLIEVKGLVAALEVADTAVKAADVTILGYESTKGSGLVVVKLSGEIGAVQAAVSAACEAVSRLTPVFAAKVIPRPHQELADTL